MNGLIFKEFRMKNRIKQKDMAESLEISCSRLCLYEKGVKQMSNSVWQKFLDVYGDKVTDEMMKTYSCENKNDYEKINVSPNLFLKKFRQKHSLKQADLAMQLGISTSYVSTLEVGSSGITETVINKFIDVYKDRLTDDDIEELYSYLYKDKSKNDITIDSFKNIGNYLVEFRKKNKIKQIELARKLGVSSKFISKLEYGKTKFPYELFQKFLDIYEDKITMEERTMLYHYVSKQNPSVFNSVVQNFVLSNDLNYIFCDLANIKLEKDQVQYLFSKLLEDAKTLKKDL